MVYLYTEVEVSALSVFPDDYPSNLLERIFEKGGSFTGYEVFRTAKYGLVDPRSFWSTYQEKKSELPLPKLPQQRQRKKKLGLSDYSTSCFLTIDRPKDICSVSLKEHPQATVIQGVTCPACGPTLLNSITGHVDWWLYDSVIPHRLFHEVEVNKDGK